MHFADGGPPGDALERALRTEMDSWAPRQPAAGLAAAALLAALLALLASAGHPLPPGLERVRDRFAP